jgi:hypothetical protein
MAKKKVVLGSESRIKIASRQPARRSARILTRSTSHGPSSPLTATGDQPQLTTTRGSKETTRRRRNPARQLTIINKVVKDGKKKLYLRISSIQSSLKRKSSRAVDVVAAPSPLVVSDHNDQMQSHIGQALSISNILDDWHPVSKGFALGSPVAAPSLQPSAVIEDQLSTHIDDRGASSSCTDREPRDPELTASDDDKDLRPEKVSCAFSCLVTPLTDALRSIGAVMKHMDKVPGVNHFPLSNPSVPLKRPFVQGQT